MKEDIEISAEIDQLVAWAADYRTADDRWDADDVVTAAIAPATLSSVRDAPDHTVVALLRYARLGLLYALSRQMAELDTPGDTREATP